MEYTPAQVKERILGRLEDALSFLLPNGFRKGHEWRVGSVAGEAGKSLAVELNGADRGAWQDFAHPNDPTQKGDILSLWAAVRGKTFKEAYPEMAEWAGFKPLQQKTVPKPRPPLPPKKDISGITPELEQYWNERGISKETLMKYKVRSHTRPSQWNTCFSCFVYIDSFGIPVMIKSTGIKPKTETTKEGVERKMKDIWTSEPYYTLWGWWLVDDDCRRIVICEGEPDTMTVFQLDPGMPVLSLPAGVSNMDWIDNDYERLSMMDEIYVITDNDPPHPKTGLHAGEECAKEISKRLGPSRVRRIPIPNGHKDPNAVLLTGEESILEWNTVWLARAYSFDPPSIQGPESYRVDAFRRLQRLRMANVENRFIWPRIPFAFRNGELTCISGYPGSGKSTFIYQSHAHEMAMGERVFICSYEIMPDQMELEFAAFLSAVAPDELTLDKAIKWLAGKCWFYKPPGRYTKRVDLKQDLFDSMDYAVKRFGATRLLVDSIHFVCKKEDYEEQDSFAEHLLDFSRTRDVHVGFVAHSKVKVGLDIIPGMEHVEGSGGIVKPIDNGLTIWRNSIKPRDIEKAEEMDNPSKLDAANALHDGLMWVWKQRLNGKHPRVKLWFNSDSKTFRLNRGEEPPSILGVYEKVAQESLF